MRLNKKGFVSTAVLYSLLLLFLALILGLLALLSNRKQILDKLKGDIKSEVNQTKNYEVYENGTAIYYNPETGKMCGDYTEENSKTGVTEGCMKWYIFNDDKNKATVNMILDHNTTALVAYNSEGTNTEMKEVKTALESDTEKWKQKARLITADEIAKITGANKDTTIKWNSNKTYGTNIETQSSLFYLDGSGSTYAEWQTQVAKAQGTSKYAWLYDYTNGCTSYGCNINDSSTYGYWTSTPVLNDTSISWVIDRGGVLSYGGVGYGDRNGVRPVITISKHEIKYDTFELVYDYTGSEQSFTAPVSGKYKIEAWGAQGYSVNVSTYNYPGGYGAYSQGIYELQKNEKLYIIVGEAGKHGNGEIVTSYSNGGSGGTGEGSYAGSGGGSTNITTESGLLSNFADNYQEKVIMVAGGGGSSTLASTYAWAGQGGSAGGINGSSGIAKISGFSSGGGGTQTSGGTAGNSSSSGQFGVGSNYTTNNAGGGGGFYGGGGSWGSAGGGGSSYIGNSLLTDKAMYCYSCTESTDENTKTISTTNVSEEPVSQYAKIGNGYAKITYLGNE